VVSDFPVGVFLLGETRGLSIRIVTGFAVFASLDVGAFESFRVFGKIILTGLFWNSLFIAEPVYLGCATAVAAASSSAVDDHLRGETHLGPGIFPDNIDAVGKRASRTEGPATTAVLGEVLISTQG